ncbi:TonB-dependent receptor [Parabacteroides sp. AM08-6]|uniref:SusC/RagA family TonB-linked outer membrane protein n=1 Tax=Parabacteroides sp. AM08-6 TaxID=2292053 RepID=UPI000EFE651D|nr:TonB-dependent receptor [Parabacteroides sp. AM08-6]RHJ86752.1 TonB-dependent receptor [Parabacteroides sp. AM08-6]
MKQIFIITLMLLGIGWCAFAQGDKKQIEVTGTVLDENNEPLIGVNIVVKDVPGLGTITDVDGKYKIKMEPYNRLVFSYIGYETQEVLVKEQTVVDVNMKVSQTQAIDEVVITATGARKKLTVTGAVTTIDVAQLKSTPSGNLVNALAGNVAGVMAMQTSGQPGQNVSEFWIRGISTFGAGSSALVLVDGFERDMNELNIEDIESFTVLKDASETAIYGSRGANGVVLITTKRGKDSKINIDAKVEVNYNTRTFTPDFVDGYQYASMMNEARITRNKEPIFLDSELEVLRMGLDPDLLPNVDWQDLLLKDGAMTYRAALNMNGGGRNARYFVSASYLEEQGMYKTDQTLKSDYQTNANHKRWNYRMNADIDITKSTLLKVGVSGYLKKQNEPGAVGNDIWRSIMGYNPVSSPVIYSNGYIPAYGYTEDSEGISYQMNPWVLATQTGYRERWWNNVETNVTLEQNLDFLTKGLSFIGRFGFDTYNENTIRRVKRPEMWKAERFRDMDGNIVYKRVVQKMEMTQYSESDGERKEYFEAEMHYNRQFNAHNLSGTLKYTQDSKVQTQNIGGDVKNSIARRHLGLAGRVAYNWNNRYFVNFNFGYTGSENFAPGNQFGFFPAYSAAWNIAEEPFIKNHLKWMDMFKFRYSWGKVGNDQMNRRFPYLYTIGAGGTDYNWGDYNFDNKYSSIRYTQPGSPNITWEIAKKHDAGLDMSLFRDLFSLTVDYFHEQRDGIFMERRYLPYTASFDANPFGNVGSVKTTGWDGNFAFKPKIGAVDLTLRGNMTLSKNEVLEKDEENNVYEYQMERGYRVDQAKGLIAIGLFKDYDDIRNSPKQEFGTVQPGDVKYKDVNGDGVINSGDRVAIGATQKPNFIYGMGASASWKGLDINVHFQGAGKCSFFIGGPTVMPFSGEQWGNIMTDVVGNYWSSRDISGTEATENPNAKYPRLSYGWNDNNYQQSTMWLRNGSYLRLKTLELGYTLPKILTAKVHLNTLRFFLIGTNLITWSSFKLWDPEQSTLQGTEYPLAKSISVGFTVNL